MKKLKIIQLFERYGENYQPYIHPLVQAIKNLKELDVKTMAFHMDEHVDIIVPKYRWRKIKEYFSALYYKTKLNYVELECLERRLDIIHIQQSFLFPKILGLFNLSELQRPKVIITLRGGDTYVKPWYNKKWEEFYRDFGNKVDAFIVMSQHQKVYLHQKWGIELKRIFVIPISFGHISKSSEKKADVNTLRVLSAFRMCWEKNIDGNLRVIKLLKTKGIPVLYDLFGDGSDVGQIYYLIEKYGLKDVVRYHGKVTNDELKARIIASDFYLQLSHSESLGMSTIEAQSFGLPAIISNSDGFPEVIKHKKSGYTVDPNDINKAAFHLENLWSQPELYKSFSKEAIDFSNSNFTISREVNLLNSLYKTIVKK